MKKLLFSIACALPLLAAGQPTTPAATATLSDTAEYRANQYISFIPGTLRLTDGRAIQAYLPVPLMYPGIDYPFIYYLQHPKSQAKPPKQNVRVDQVQNMTAGTHYFEPMRLKGQKKTKILAERVVDGPVEVFLQAEQQSIPIAIPLPGAMAYSGIPYKNSHFFVRRDSVLTKVDRGMFYMQMSQYLSDYPEMASMIAHNNKGYRYADLIRIVSNYNRYKANLTGAAR